MKKIVVDDRVFTQFPDFKRGLIIVSSINNLANNTTIEKMLFDEIEGRRVVDHTTNNFVKAWDDVHRAFGSNPNKFPPSIKSLLKRIQKDGSFPFINSTVALFNYISIKYLIPCGGDDVDRIEGNMVLGISSGTEKFIALGSDEQETPIAGEVIYYDDKSLNVMCRRWNWRNGSFTKISESTTRMVINIDGVGTVSKKYVEDARDELAKLLVEQCNAIVTTNFLDRYYRFVEIQDLMNFYGLNI